MPKGVAISLEVKAKAVLRVVAGEPISKVADCLGFAHQTVWRWCKEITEEKAAEIAEEYSKKPQQVKPQLKARNVDNSSPDDWMFKSQNTYYKITRSRPFRWTGDEWRSSTVSSRDLRGMQKNPRLA